MNRSVGEIRPEVTKAARGAGTALGTAEDLAGAAPWLDAGALGELADTLETADGPERLNRLSAQLDRHLSGQVAEPPAGLNRIWQALLASVTDRPAPEGARDVPQALWSRLAAFSARTYVPETELSRSRGAGAGLLDND